MDYSLDDIAGMIAYRLHDEYILDRGGGELFMMAWQRFSEKGVIDIYVKTSEDADDRNNLHFTLRVVND